jgi:hypothetical protein
MTFRTSQPHMGSDGAGCTDFGVSRQGELTIILDPAGLTCLQNKALTPKAEAAAVHTCRNCQTAPFNLKNLKAILQFGKNRKNRPPPGLDDSSWTSVFSYALRRNTL